MKRTLAVTAFVVFLSPAARGQITKPIRYTWMAQSCMELRRGRARHGRRPQARDRPPHRSGSRPWLILKRVEEGAIVIDENEPFGCETFTSVSVASSHFSAMDTCHALLILNVPDGRAVVASLLKCPALAPKQRAVR